MTYNPEIWLESAVRELKAYIADRIDNSVLDNVGNPVGLYDPANPSAPGIYELVMEFPTPESMRNRVPLQHTIIHFEIDAIDNRYVGMGNQIMRNNYNPVAHTITPQEAGWHQINFDVGIWTSDKAGGTTARMRAFQILNTAFQGKLAQQAFDARSDGGDGRIEILEFSGGRFITETINDVITYRSVEGSLELRVFSRTPLAMSPTVPTIEEILQEPGLVIIE
jgi:hypothetical protein